MGNRRVSNLGQRPRQSESKNMVDPEYRIADRKKRKVDKHYPIRINGHRTSVNVAPFRQFNKCERGTLLSNKAHQTNPKWIVLGKTPNLSKILCRGRQQLCRCDCYSIWLTPNHFLDLSPKNGHNISSGSIGAGVIGDRGAPNLR